MTEQRHMHYDVAIIGGGPGGSTTAALLKKYDPELRVAVFEKERFPRDHVGESQLPPIGDILEEMGCWDKVEAANFPIKIGATYRWGRSPEFWDFEFLPIADFKDEPRPAKYEGQRRQTAFQVERSTYDDILLRHAEQLGAEVHEETRVRSVETDGDRVQALVLDDGSSVRADHYVDASGHIGLLRRAMNIETEVPTRLRNVAFWDYWENADWAVEIGVGGTRVQVMSQGYGWIWFIPLSPTRTSIGLVCAADYYKESAKSAEQLYTEAIANDDHISQLVANGTRRGELETTTDWSFLAERTVGENWMLVGESAGFADPILAAGMTLTHTSAREAAYTILELNRGEHDPQWLKSNYDKNQRSRVRQHIRFADFWYATNGQFTDLQDHCAEIAREAGMRMTPQAAWRWLAQGGFTNDTLGQAGVGGLDIAGMKQVSQRFTGKEARWQIDGCNVFKLNLTGAEKTTVPQYKDGRIVPVDCYVKGRKRLPLAGMYNTLTQILEKTHEFEQIRDVILKRASMSMPREHVPLVLHHAMQALEVMVSDGWVIAKVNKKKPRLEMRTPEEGALIHSHDPGETASPQQAVHDS